MEEWHTLCDKFVGAPIKGGKLYKCGAGMGIIHCNPYGNVNGCIMMRDGFSIRDHELRYIWDEGIYSVVSREKDFSTACDTCHFTALCDQCAPWSALENNDIRKPVEYLCNITATRGKYFDFLNPTSK
jgi:radical SAM protein with 4Fe4S-binding SPASM domain